MKNGLKKLMKQRNITPKELSNELGIGRTTIYQIMNFKSIPNTEYALKLSKYFNVSVEELFFED